jgi:hypothetical protein
MPANWQMLLGGLSNAAGDIATRNNLNSQRARITKGYGDVANDQARANTMIGDTVAELASSNPSTYATPLAREYGAAAQAAPVTASVAPNIGSQRFKTESAAAKGAVSGYGGRSAAALAAVDAAQRQRTHEGEAMGQLSSDLTTVGRNAGMDEFLARLQAQRQRVNPWTQLLAAIGGRIATNFTAKNPNDALREIDVNTIPARLPAPSTTPTMRPFPTYGG